MIKCDFHVHTVYSDGKNTPREIVEEAISKGLSAVGFSEHSYTPFDDSDCRDMADPSRYVSEIAALKREYGGVITVLCGVEQDIFSGFVPPCFDYSIGSVHYIRAGDGYVSVDNDPGELISAADRYFGGDMLTVAERYFENVGRVIEATGADVVGHFDLITKFNEGGELFDSGSPRYRKAWTDAADRLLSCGKPFEINTGAVSRGYRCSPYPSAEEIGYIKARGGRFILLSDSHRKETLCFGFDEYEKLCEGAAGYSPEQMIQSIFNVRR